jgi:hypothetical protein
MDHALNSKKELHHPRIVVAGTGEALLVLPCSANIAP